MALAAALLLAPEEARARDECGTLVNGAVTCADASSPYVFGIRYDVANGWGNGIAGDAAVTFVGGSMTTVPSAPITGWGSAIVIRTAQQADTTSRTISLLAGVGANAGNAVRITQPSGAISGGFDNTGIVIHQRGVRADAVTVTLGTGVDIGTMTAPMKRSGVHVLVESNLNTADHSITSAADIYSSAFGLLMDARGSGSTTVTNSGSITNVATANGVTGQADGIRILDWSGTGGNERPATATTTVTNSGSISVSQANGIGINMDAEGLGLYKTVNSGTVSATTTAAHGIFVNARRHWGAAGTEAVEIENSGSITTASTSAFGIYVASVDDMVPQGRGDGNLEITNSGAISSMNTAILVNSNMGDTTVKHTGGSITATGAAAVGIRVQQGGTGAVTVESGADVTADNHGILVLGSPTPAATTVTVTVAAGVTTRTNEPALTIAASGTTTTYDTLGDVSVTHSGGEITSSAESGIWVQQAGADATVESSADVTAKKYGIFVTNNPALATRLITAAGMTTDTYATTGAVSVTHSAGTISAETEAGIHAQNAAGNADAVTVTVSGGSVTTEGQSKAAVVVLQNGAGDAVASASGGAALTSKHNAGVYADLSHAANDAGQVKITQGGTIAARTGVYARIGRVSATGETRAQTAQPAIDVTWSGTFSHGTTASVAADDADRFLARDVAHAVAVAQEVETEGAFFGTEGEPLGGPRYGAPAGIEAQVMSWRAVMAQVARGDDPGAFADAAAVTALFDAGADAATKARAAAIIAAFRTALTNDDLDTIPGAAAIDTDGTAGLSDDEIETYLSVNDAARRTLLQNVLAQDLSAEEKAVLRAVAADDTAGLTAALNDADAGFSDGYKTAVRALLERRNIGDIRVAVTGGSIAASRGDGIRAYYATRNDDNGAISVTIAAGATVSGGMAGVYVANAGAMGTGAERILKQTVTVNGMVMGGTDAAVHLVGGGTLTIGAMGKLVAGSSGRAILVNDPGRSTILIGGEVRGGSGTTAAIETTGGGVIVLGATGRIVLAEGASNAIRINRGSSDDPLVAPALVVDGEKVYQENARDAVARLGGNVVGDGVGDTVRLAVTDQEGLTGMGIDATLNNDGTIDIPGTDTIPNAPEPPPTDPTDPMDMDMACDDATDGRCRLYEALPSALLSMNGLPSYRERVSSARSAGGGWARIEAASGKWKASRSTEDDVAYNRQRTGLRAGVDMAVGEEGLVGLSAHGVTGSAKMTGNGGKVAVTGVGLGLNATAQTADGIHIDAQLAVTRYKAKLTSQTGTTLNDGARGTGYALALEAGRALPMGGGVSMTPRAGLAWSQVSLRGFTDTRGASVSMKNAGSFAGGVGVDVETAPAGGGPRLYGSLDVAHRFSRTTETLVSGTSLTATAAPTSVRVGLGFAQDWDDRHALQASLGYATAGSGNGEFGGALSFTTRF